MSQRRKVAAGNWKMNGLSAALAEIQALATAFPAPACEVVICPPATLLAQMNWQIGQAKSPFRIGGQDCHQNVSGAHTGDLSAIMLKDAGASHVILGHSERRVDHGESDALVRIKAQSALQTGLVAIICLGETSAQRDGGSALGVIESQLSGSLPHASTPANTIIAYEPVWAIGTGRTATAGEIAEAHSFIRDKLNTRFGAKNGDAFRILYGGSVKAANAAEIFAVANVDGALVGGASLKAADFAPIIVAASA